VTTRSRTDYPSTPPHVADDLRLTPPAVLVLAAIIVAVAQWLPAGPPRAIVVVPILLLVPGWSACLAVFGRSRPADVVIELTFAVVLGMSVIILNGLIVNAVGLRLSERSLLVGPGVVACVALVVAWVRGTAATLPIPVAKLGRVGLAVGVLGCSLAIGVGGVVYAADRLPSQASPAFAELSFAQSYVRRAQAPQVPAAHNVSVPVQMRLRGVARAKYNVLTYVDGAQVDVAHVDVAAPLWTKNFVVTAPRGRCLHRVQIIFYPQTRGLEVVSLDTYLSVTSGPACRR
jgi:hypothetical protein